jgi:hypothetical protein
MSASAATAPSKDISKDTILNVPKLEWAYFVVAILSAELLKALIYRSVYVTWREFAVSDGLVIFLFALYQGVKGKLKPKN